MKNQFVLLVAVTVGLVIYTAFVIAEAGYTGFLQFAWSHAWGGQMFVDLVIALVLFAIWMAGDARERGINPWPYLALILTTGSIGALDYLVHRTARELRAETNAGAA